MAHFTTFHSGICMRVLLRQSVSHAYLKEPDEWTTDAGRAHNFETAGRLLEFTLINGLADVEIYLAFGDSKYNLAIPIITAQAEPPKPVQTNYPPTPRSSLPLHREVLAYINKEFPDHAF